MIAEVYTLNAFVVLVLLALALRRRALALAERRPTRLPAAMGLIFGLGLCNHWLLLSTPAIVLVLWPAGGQVPRALPRTLPWLLLGLLPCARIVLRSQQPIPNFASTR